ncbi:hypothetical protein T459_18782 [Capsicum annuum]|uniref:Uncharacterized protein n=1 Tax=Capsicum annuum TaxID=4072 RepID=A0A2G2YZR3_CAPAN|nr:hypothetical protein FXO37_17645 [Capsicum annuum]PHT75260.1 hypothetical protein T459_18782 [Capsicum annuum]
MVTNTAYLSHVVQLRLKSLPNPTKTMANARIARFVTEVAPPQFINVMRHRASKRLETIKEEEREASTSKSLSLKSSSILSSSTYSASSSNAKNSKYFLKEVQREQDLNLLEHKELFTKFCYWMKILGSWTVAIMPLKYRTVNPHINALMGEASALITMPYENISTIVGMGEVSINNEKLFFMVFKWRPGK